MFESIANTIRERNGGDLPFKDLIASIRNKIDTIRENKRMGGDILFMITYMTSITTSEATRPEIFAYTSSRSEYATAKYIKKVEFFVKRWNYSYAEALRLIAERLQNSMLRSMLNRYGNSIDSGVPDDEFLRLELSTVRRIYRNTFEQGFEMLKKWGDAYIAMMLSATIVGIIIMVSVAIYSPDDVDSTLNLSYMIILLIAIFGITTMYRAIPEDNKTHGIPHQGSHEQKMIKRLEIFLVPIAIISGVILFLIGSDLGVIAIFVSLLLAPLGIIGLKDDIHIGKRDEDFSVFIRGLGSIMGGKGLTTTYAIAEVDKKSLEILGPSIAGVYSKLNLGLNEKIVWDRFIGDSGSHLIYKYLNIFRDSISLGGSPAEIGKIVSSSMLEQVLLRKKREMLSTGFIVLLVPMHIAMVAIFMFLYQILVSMSRAITEVMTSFSESSVALSSGSSSGSISGSMMGTVGVFTNFPEEKIAAFVGITLLMITLSNIFAAKIVKGGDRYMYYFFGSLLFAVTGIVYVIAPFVVDLFFQIPVFEAV
jgi:flagellar protein FlaJ